MRSEAPSFVASPPGKSVEWIRQAIGRLAYLRFRLLQKHRYDNYALEHVAGAPIALIPGVLNPTLARTGEFFATYLRDGNIAREADVLDMGTGSGVCAIVAARKSCQVVAVDINPAAVRCAQINALLNQVEARVTTLQGNLFDSVAGRRFDVVLFNPPFLRGTPRNNLDHAWRSVDVPERFAAQLREHLKPGGYALLLLSTFGGADTFVSLFDRSEWRAETVAQRRYLNETLSIVRLS